MVSEEKIYVDILEQQSRLICEASSANWGCCNEYAKFSFFSRKLRKTVFLCAKHLTWILEEPEQEVSGERVRDYETVGKKTTAFLVIDLEGGNRPCMAVHAAGRRRGKVCGLRNTFCFYSFIFKDYIYLCRRHFLWIDGQVAHVVSFMEQPNDKGQVEESTNSSINFLANLNSDVSPLSFSDVVLNTSPVTPTRRKENDSTGAMNQSDSTACMAEGDTLMVEKPLHTTASEKEVQKNSCNDDISGWNAEKSRRVADAVGKMDVTDTKHRSAYDRLKSTDHIWSDGEASCRGDSDSKLVVGEYDLDDVSEEKSLQQEQSCPTFFHQRLPWGENSKDEVSTGQPHDTLRKHVSGRLKSLHLKSESISRLLLHRGRPRSPTIDEHSTTSLPTHLHKDIAQVYNEGISTNKPNIFPIPVTTEMSINQKLENNDTCEQSEESSAVSEKEDPSLLNVAARIVLDSHGSQTDDERNINSNVLHSSSGHNFTSTKFSESKFSTTEEANVDNTAPNSYLAPAPVRERLEQYQQNDSCCCSIC